VDIQHLVDRLEDLIDEGWHFPGTKYTFIDEERALEIIDQMRISIPEEIEKSTRIIQQRDRVMAQANEEADRMVQLAKEKGDSLINREAIAQAAQSRAANIIEQAKQDAVHIKADADKYVLEVLGELESQLIRTLTVVRNGINMVNQDRNQGPAPTQATPKLPAQKGVAVPAEAEKSGK
jgi:cell division septum initiation protein DivIVA